MVFRLLSSLALAAVAAAKVPPPLLLTFNEELGTLNTTILDFAKGLPELLPGFGAAAHELGTKISSLVPGATAALDGAFSAYAAATAATAMGFGGGTHSIVTITFDDEGRPMLTNTTDISPLKASILVPTPDGLFLLTVTVNPLGGEGQRVFSFEIDAQGAPAANTSLPDVGVDFCPAGYSIAGLCFSPTRRGVAYSLCQDVSADDDDAAALQIGTLAYNASALPLLSPVAYAPMPGAASFDSLPAFAPNGTAAYALVKESRGLLDDAHTIQQYTLDGETGAPAYVASFPLPDAVPPGTACGSGGGLGRFISVRGIAVDPSGRFLFAAAQTLLLCWWPLPGYLNVTSYLYTFAINGTDGGLSLAATKRLDSHRLGVDDVTGGGFGVQVRGLSFVDGVAGEAGSAPLLLASAYVPPPLFEQQVRDAAAQGDAAAVQRLLEAATGGDAGAALLSAAASDTSSNLLVAFAYDPLTGELDQSPSTAPISSSGSQVHPLIAQALPPGPDPSGGGGGSGGGGNFTPGTQPLGPGAFAGIAFACFCVVAGAWWLVKRGQAKRAGGSAAYTPLRTADTLPVSASAPPAGASPSAYGTV